MSKDGVRAHLSFANVTSSLALFIALGGGAYAASGGFVAKNGTIRLCVGKHAALTVAKAGKRCKRHTRALVINQRGRGGSVGAVGSAGPPGAAGPQGPAGQQGVPGPATGPAGGVLAGSYPNPSLAAGAVTTEAITGGAVTTSKFAASAVAPDAALLGGVAPEPAAIPMNLLNGWQPYGTLYDQPAYWVDAFGTVHLKGSLAQPVAGSDVLFVLPVGLRPSRSSNWPATLDSAHFGTIEIEADGSVRSRTFNATQAAQAQAFTSLEGVSFRPSDP